MRGLWAKASTASVPTEMVQLIVAARKIDLPDETAIFGEIGSRSITPMASRFPSFPTLSSAT
jgi:hypothetical protein